MMRSAMAVVQIKNWATPFWAARVQCLQAEPRMYESSWFRNEGGTPSKRPKSVCVPRIARPLLRLRLPSSRKILPTPFVSPDPFCLPAVILRAGSRTHHFGPARFAAYPSFLALAKSSSAFDASPFLSRTIPAHRTLPRTSDRGQQLVSNPPLPGPNHPGSHKSHLAYRTLAPTFWIQPDGLCAIRECLAVLAILRVFSAAVVVADRQPRHHLNHFSKRGDCFIAVALVGVRLGTVYICVAIVWGNLDGSCQVRDCLAVIAPSCVRKSALRVGIGISRIESNEREQSLSDLPMSPCS